MTTNLTLLGEVTEEFASYLSEVTDGDLSAPTPCASWDIQALYDHVIDANAAIAGQLDPRASQLDFRAGQPAPGGGPAARETRYRDSAHCAAAAIAGAFNRDTRPHACPGSRSPGLIFQEHLANTLIHTWDLAQAIQIDFDCPSLPAIEIALRYLRQLPPAARGQAGPFAESLDYPPAEPMHEVLYLSGRFPGWRPAGRQRRWQG